MSSFRPRRPAANFDQDSLQRLVPLESMNAESFRQVINQMTVEEWPAGKRLFNQGDSDPDTLFLLEGEIEMGAVDGERFVVTGGSDRARYALAALKPRRYTALCQSDVTIARVNGQVLDKVLGWDQLARGEGGKDYEVAEINGTEDSGWMLRFMRSELFRRLPTENLQLLVSRFEKVPVAGAVVIVSQGEAGDFYYMILEGRCLVSRKSETRFNTVELAALGPGDSFGEEALLSGAPRNATVSTLEDGVLLRLGKKDFDELLKEPILRRVSPAEASSMVRDGAGLLDVRLESEFRNGTIRRAENLPLYRLRLMVRALDPRRSYVLFCDTGARSAAAAFLLSERGFDVYVLDGGLAKYNKVLVGGTADPA